MDTITLDPRQKARLDRVAGLMLDIYQTLARMKYLDPEWIVPGPHDASDTISYYRGKIDDSILYLYSILPYVDAGGAMEIDFYDGGEFARFDDGSDVEVGRNPLWAQEEDEMMRSWMTPLSMIGNHCTTIIYGSDNHSIWIFNQMADGSVDPGPCDQSSRSSETSDQTDSDDGSDYDSEDEELYGEYFRRDNCRPAGEVLRDINKWYKSLKHLPGGGQHSPGDWDQTLTGPLYVKHGWLTGDFDGVAFHVDRIRSFAAREAKEQAEKAPSHPDYAQVTARDESNIQRLTQEVDTATTLLAEWDARRNLLREQLNQDFSRIELERAKDNTFELKEQDMPLWETEWLRMALEEKLKFLQDHQDKVSKAEAPDAVQDRANRLQLKFKQQEVEIYQQAYEAAKLDAERLCPGQSFTSSTGWQSLDMEDSPSVELEWLEKTREVSSTHVTQLKSFLEQLPQEATEIRRDVEQRIDWKQTWMESRYLHMKQSFEAKIKKEETSAH